MQGELCVKQQKSGTFEGHDIRGLQYEDGDGETGWLITSRAEQESMPTYCWVNEDEETMTVNVNDWPRFENSREIRVLGPKNVGSSEKSAILAAIHSWKSHKP
jgi:hypothetical protein